MSNQHSYLQVHPRQYFSYSRNIGLGGAIKAGFDLLNIGFFKGLRYGGLGILI